MKLFRHYIGDLFLCNRFYLAMGGCILFFAASFFYMPLFPLAKLAFNILLALVLVDYLVLFTAKTPGAKRIIAERLSNGDDNTIRLEIANNARFETWITVIDELPVQFQERNFSFHFQLKGGAHKAIRYTVHPVERGEHFFGHILLYVRSGLGLLERRHTIDASEMVPVYPSYLQLRPYELISHTAVQLDSGNKRMRKIGHSMEFEQIKEYVSGDDIRNINWKATARRDMLMVNNYTDERSQQVYCIIDKGRLMRMPFNGLSLLDYAINSALVVSNVCLRKQDKVGLITFANKIGTMLAADRKPVQRENILQLLYNQQTAFQESDFEMLYMQLRSRIKQRSLLMLFTNFESLSGLKRQLDYLRSIARHHLLLVVFFENTGLKKLAAAPADNLEQVYVKTIAEKFAFEKKLIVKELQKNGILSILTSPEQLTINTVNKYLELKARQAI